jgi:hypothetical protein
MSDKPKEFDEVFKPKEKKTQQLETFEDETKTKKEDVKQEETMEESEWKPYFERLNENYARTVKEIGMKNQYSIPIVNGDGNTKNTFFERKRLSVKELRQIAAKQKEYADRPKNPNSLFEAEELASLYLEYAQMLLVNASTRKPITKEEFETQDWGNIRAIVDDCLLKSLVGTTG